jgi:hypothetical protein
MQSLFEPAARENVHTRLGKVRPDSQKQWGKMSPAQMLAHCANALEVAAGDRPRKQALIGKILAPFVRKKVLGEEPFSRNSPTDPTFVIRDERDFDAEKSRLVAVIDRFCDRGPDHAGRQTHSFLGRLSGEEWGVMMYKHLDHHFRQFGV